MKGVLLAGGTGSRLHPLTRITNKHLLPIYDRPMINWGIEALVNAGITEIMLVTGGTHAGEFLRLLGNGHEFGIDRLSYGYQERPGGIAEALGLAARFVDGDPVLVMLADNIVERLDHADGRRLQRRPARCPHPAHTGRGGRAPPAPGRADLRRRQAGGRHRREARRIPQSKFGVTGIYCYDADVFEVIPTLVPSGRGELEITDVNNHYISQGRHGLRRAGGLLGRCRRVDRRLLQGQRLRPHARGQQGLTPGPVARSVGSSVRGHPGPLDRLAAVPGVVDLARG